MFIQHFFADEDDKRGIRHKTVTDQPNQLNSKIEDGTKSSNRNIKIIIGGKYIDDITRWCEPMNFILEWWKQYFTKERSELIKYCFAH